VLDQVQKLTNVSNSYLDQCLEGELELTKGVFFLEQKNFCEASKNINRALEIFKGQEALQYTNISRCYRRIGELSAEQKQYKKALEYFQVGIDIIQKKL